MGEINNKYNEKIKFITKWRHHLQKGEVRGACPQGRNTPLHKVPALPPLPEHAVPSCCEVLAGRAGTASSHHSENCLWEPGSHCSQNSALCLQFLYPAGVTLHRTCRKLKTRNAAFDERKTSMRNQSRCPKSVFQGDFIPPS